MDAVLKEPVIIELLEDVFFEEEEYLENQNMERPKSSLWVKEGEAIRPTTNISLQKKLDPGIYKVLVTRDHGLHCTKMNIASDELFVFSDSIIEPLITEINRFWDKKDTYTENNLVHKRGILLEGYPGTGKSSIISLLSKEIIKRKGIVFKVEGPNNLGTYINFLQTGFREIEPDTPIITILEDIDRFEDSEQLLDFLDGKSQIEHNVVIATTNNTEEILDAFLRPSRLDLRIETPLPTKKIREEYFIHKKVSEEEAKDLAEKSENFSFADLKELYISIYLLGYSIEDSVKKINVPKEKKDYTVKPLSFKPIGL